MPFLLLLCERRVSGIEGDGRLSDVDDERPRKAQRIDLVHSEPVRAHRHHLALVLPGQDRELEAEPVVLALRCGVDHEHVVGAVGEHAVTVGTRQRETPPVTATTGRLLVAEPMLGDPNFDRTVILMLQHNADGALGLVLNRPTDVTIGAALPDWQTLATDPAVLHIGGPVEDQSGWCLGRARGPELAIGFVPVLGDLGLVDLELDPVDLAPMLRAVRLYAGYSGWGPGQLEHELAQDAWFVVDAEPDDPFLPDGATLWTRILSRQGGPLARLAHFPVDPSVN